MSRVSLVAFLVFYTAYEVTVGLGTGILVDYANDLPAAEQAVVADAIQHYNEDNILGDPISVSLVAGLLGWMVAMVAAAVALRRAGAGWAADRACRRSRALFAIHPPPVGPAALVCFAAAAVLIERRWALVATAGARQSRPSSSRSRRDSTSPNTKTASREELAMKTPIIQNEPEERSASQPSLPPPTNRGSPPTWPAGWDAGARSTGRPPSSAGSRSCRRVRGRHPQRHDQDRRRPRPAWASPAGPTSSSTRSSGPAGRRERPRPERPLTVNDPAFAAAVEDVVARVAALDAVTNVRSPLDPENAGQIGSDGQRRAHRLRDQRGSATTRRQDRSGRRRGPGRSDGEPGDVHRPFGVAPTRRSMPPSWTTSRRPGCSRSR